MSEEDLEDATARWNGALQEAIAAKSGEVFTDIVFDFGVEIMNQLEFPTAEFDALLAILRDHRLHGLTGSRHLVAVFNFEFETLTRDQDERLLKTFEEVYASFSDWETSHYIAEMVGQRYADGRGLDALERMRRTKNQVARGFVANGLEQLARTNRDPLIVNRAMDQILSMRGDISEQVNAHVDEAIERLIDRGAMGRA